MSDPEVAILHNDAALHSLKRVQLLQLVRRFGLKGSGKVRGQLYTVLQGYTADSYSPSCAGHGPRRPPAGARPPHRRARLEPQQRRAW